MLYEVNRRKIESSSRVEMVTLAQAGLKEEHIETFLASHLDEVVSEDQLLLITRQRPLRAEADIMALDREGRLYIFELKRGESRQEDLLQVMRYGQKFGRYSYDKLDDLAKRRREINQPLQDAHKAHFDLSVPLQKSAFNHEQVFILITNGMDMNTISAVNYWAKQGLKIKTFPYHVYKIDGGTYVHFNTYSPEGDVSSGDLGYYLVNTCRTWRPEACADMLKKCKASAYYGAKYAISNNLSEGDVIYLYHNQVGVIAKGTATSDCKETSCDGNKGEEYYVPLNFEWVLDEKEWEDKAVKAWEINERRPISYRRTVSSIPKEAADIIDEISQKKRKKK